MVDEVVVVDTGSVDATVAIAARHGARVLTRPWDGDFAAARNLALDACRGRWLLYIDADERLAADSSPDHLRRTLAAYDDQVVAARVAFRPTQHSTRYLEYRLLRNRPDLRFAGRIHETMVPDVMRLEAGGGRVERAPASIEHLGYEGDLTTKYQRDLPLLEAEVEADPTRTYLWFALGVAAAGLGRQEQADTAWASGVAAARAQGQLDPADLPLFAELVLHRLNHGADPLDGEVDRLIAEMAAGFPDDPLTVWVSANRAMAAGRWAEAVGLLDQLVSHRAGLDVHPVLAYDTRLFGALGQHALGVCWLQLDDPARAAEHLRVAVADEPTNPEYRVKLDLAEARARP